MLGFIYSAYTISEIPRSHFAVPFPVGRSESGERATGCRHSDARSRVVLGVSGRSAAFWKRLAYAHARSGAAWRGKGRGWAWSARNLGHCEHAPRCNLERYTQIPSRPSPTTAPPAPDDTGSSMRVSTTLLKRRGSSRDSPDNARSRVGVTAPSVAQTYPRAESRAHRSNSDGHTAG